ncbi:amidohydrolase [Desulfitibacter alkalitolerans]|uniref:amidohydrolase n=1 Tax=Desulfitibacter alkalitolerans TaxID=264641 RepID=UPI000482B991|nr:amidohydrolase [Desulfitibacter alkalitolerans]
MKRTVIKNGYILTMERDINNPGDNYFQGDVILNGDKIESVHIGSRKYVSDDFHIIDAAGMAVMPGLINCHTHAAMTLLRGYADDLPLMEWLEKKIWPLEAKLQPEYVYWGTKLAVLEMIRGGTTCFADMYFMMDQVAEAVEETGIRASLSRGLISFNNGQKALEESIDFVKKYHETAEGRITTMLAPHAPYTCVPEYLQEVSHEAKKLGVGIHIHIAETLAEVSQIKEKYGKSPVEMVYDAGVFAVSPVLAAHCVHMSDNDLKILAREKVNVAHNPESNMKLASGIAPVTKMIEMNINVGIGTDGAASNNNLDMFQEMRSAALLQKVHTYNPTVISSYQALAMATCCGARALGLDQEIGKIQAGMQADIILVDLNSPHLQPLHDVNAHLVYSAGAADVDTVIINGRVVMKNKEIKTIDEERVTFEIRDIIKKLI